ncbi:hypothetical protein [Laspinema olomoucense]|uniref:hypothetical protein n=1 Tax=Laspinema olomoucense TaxID=3231600 RepID=UPI0021BBAFB8|nr:hypothetical protein [Laspinema sp. D3a]MCT7987634.1 hypothetical protein [Laspinema sp. D3a]
MEQAQLIKTLGISESSFRRWRKELRIPAKDSYSDEEKQQFQDLKDLLDSGEKFRDAIATISGQPPSEENPFATALMNRAKSQLNALRPQEIGEALVDAFDQEVAVGFLKGIKRKKPTAFEQMVGSFSPLAIEGDDCLEALILEAADDEVA